MINAVKKLFGICACKGCLNRGMNLLTFDGVDKNTGKPKTIKFRLCHEHVMQFIEESGAEIKSVSIS